MEAMQSQDGDSSESCQSQPPEQPLNHYYQDFYHFVNEVGPLEETTLNYSQCNKYIKLKQTDYIPDSKVLQYYENVFSKKTCNVVRRKWHMKDKFILFWVIFKLCVKKKFQIIKIKYSDWDDVVSILKLPKEFLMRKWISLIRHTTCHFRWTCEEQKTLKSQLTTNTAKPKWSDLAIKIYRYSGSNILRTCKDVREHWKNYLDPEIKKESWTQIQDRSLLKLISQSGKKWSLIAKTIGGRTQNQVKNRYLALMKKQRKVFHTNKKLKSEQRTLQQIPLKSQIISVQDDKIKVEQSRNEDDNDLLGQMPEEEAEAMMQNYLAVFFPKDNSNSMFFQDR